MRKIFLLCVLIFLLAACNLPRPGLGLSITPSDVTPTNTPPSTAEYTQCAWNWATQALPDLSTEVQAAMDAAGLKGVTARAEAYGENCITASGKVDHFAAMETDYRITLAVSDLNDTVALGDLLTQTLAVIDQFPIKETPGPGAGYIGITFQSGEQVENLWFNRAKSDELRSQGLSGINLYEALKTK